MKKINVLWLIILAAGLTCESPFSTREAQPPLSNVINWLPPTDPRLVLENLCNAIQNCNVAYYIRCLHDQFTFVADENEVSNHNPDAWKFKDWNFQIEQEVMTRMFNLFRDTIRVDNQTIEMSLDRTEQADIESPHDSTRLYRDYEIRIYHSYPEYPTLLKGTSIFIMKEDAGGFWSISTWEDIKRDTLDWGALKGIFRY